MSSDSGLSRQTQGVTPRSDARSRIDLVAWAVFFIWIGSSTLANISWGWFLLGVGAIVLAAQAAALRIPSENVDAFWLTCGGVFLAAGIWEIFSLKWPLAPALIILLGVGVLWQAFFGKPESKR